jgi:hypothetical protein
VSIEEGELLLPMGGIVGRVQVDRDVLSPALQALPMVCNDGGRQRAASRYNARGDIACSKRDRVDSEVKGASVTGSRPITSLCSGSSASRASSFASSYPQARPFPAG